MNGLFLVDRARSGAENMAMDQRMLERAAELERPLLRIYQWDKPTLSLGYFQKYAERLTHSASAQIDVVRRATGGGSIVHHHDWTYSIAMPSHHLSGSRSRYDLGASQDLYDCVHSSVVDWLGDKGLQAQQWNGVCNASLPSQTDKNAKAKCSFLCFERRSSGDVVVGESKVLGSAQRRFRGALLQHGSLLLMRSSYAPSLPGLRDLSAPGSFGSAELLVFVERIRHAAATFTGGDFKHVGSANELLTGWELVEGRECLSWLGKR
jgi:lipoyl(octanoyl) transferase